MENKKLFDYVVDETLNIFVLIKSAEVRVAKNGKDFLSMVFEDRSGDISGKFWDASSKDIQNFEAGKVIFLNGKRENYKGSPQIKILGIRLATETEPNNPNLYTKKAPMSEADMREEVSKLLFDITNPNWNRVVRYLLQKYDKQFYTYPAAKTNHHAFQGGLAYHTISILRLAKQVSNQYPQIDRSLLYAGSILHDLGKTVELSGPVSTTYTVEGNLLGHIVIMDGEIVKACQELKISDSSEDILLLRHMIVSHHGLKEYGSPIEPLLLEAVVLHALDDLDASIQMVTGALDHTKGGTFSERLFAMNGRNFYKRLDHKTE
ncbi:3'-_5' exoribonuclease Bsu YhaM [Pediococcus damnosus]|uniref:3'->5' exoribonuclease Bsu YhaM n=2 Tax=Pediococcus damnosus TaxID=51663 RepID=A0A0R2HMI4_9LACO|nr:HD domain-containing protein [Pediococcus damnosus]AMV61334.1 3'->5' exoribonuclease Bsu YhaM [Pediococcus damnosus]AMV62312.1 3'->5' exoribonuclease Bsu YhaM [Pediococcus damnosus]AMV65693.1 3'->5' exoribonuclease Bsu YhaM [Pediococcus damnosus]AMV67830.1 3'->5' exoribonuclease Bsu YhaM [Pediococcus damnosus]AMV70034.1 3'->5' exoribonuclease Bsu YhaM [Pediococcus damnosus]